MARYATQETVLECMQCDCVFTKRESLTEPPNITCPKCKWTAFVYQLAPIVPHVRVRTLTTDTPIQMFIGNGQTIG